MKVLFKSLMGLLPKTRRTESDVLAAGVSINKEARAPLLTSEKLKLSNAARGGVTTNSPSPNLTGKY